MDAAAKGKKALESNDFHSAVALYTSALISHPNSPDYFIKRATAFSRLSPPRHHLALHDAEIALLLGKKRGKRENIQDAQQRRVVALYGLGRYADAKFLLDVMAKRLGVTDKKDKMDAMAEKMGTTDKRPKMQLDMWTARVNKKLEGQEEAVVNVKEDPTIDLLSEKELQAWLKSQLKKDGTFRMDDEADETESLTSTQKSSSANGNGVESVTSDDEAAIAQAKAAVVPVQPVVQTIRHDYYQNNDKVMISIYAKKVDPEKVVLSLSEDNVVLSFPHPDTTETYCFSLTPPFALVDASQSGYKVLGTKLELTLSKKDAGLKWPTLASTTGAPRSTTTTTVSLPTAAQPTTVMSKAVSEGKLPTPYASKSGKEQDWDKVAADLTKKKDKKSKPKATADAARKKGDGNDDDSNEDSGGEASDPDSEFGGDAVDGFFKKLFAGADPDTRKAMIKSFTESNGTALSTNWNEVSKGKVEEVQSQSDK